MVMRPYFQLPGCSNHAFIFQPRVALRFRPPLRAWLGSASVDGGTCPTPCHAPANAWPRQRVTRERRDIRLRIRKLVFCCRRLREPVGLCFPRLASAAWLALSPAYSNCRTRGAWASRAPGACRVPRTHPCSHAMLLHASIAPSHPSTAPHCASEALARCSCPLATPFLLEQPDFHILARVVRPCPQAVNKSGCPFFLFIFLLSRLHLPADDATLVVPKLTLTSPRPVLLHSGTPSFCTGVHRRGRHL